MEDEFEFEFEEYNEFDIDPKELRRAKKFADQDMGTSSKGKRHKFSKPKSIHTDNGEDSK